MRYNTLQCKEVININTGCKIGYVCDIILDDRCLCVVALIVHSASLFGFFNVFRAEEELEINMSRVVNIGEDVILVDIIL
jgi:Uncharacterized conserved protein